MDMLKVFLGWNFGYVIRYVLYDEETDNEETILTFFSSLVSSSLDNLIRSETTLNARMKTIRHKKSQMNNIMHKSLNTNTQD